LVNVNKPAQATLVEISLFHGGHHIERPPSSSPTNTEPGMCLASNIWTQLDLDQGAQPGWLLCLRPSHKEIHMYQRILVATDGSTLSKKAATAAIDLSVALDAELIALYVVPRYSMSYLEGDHTVSLQEVARIEKQWSEKAQSIVDRVQAAALSRGLTARAALAHSNLIGESIIKAAAKYKCDLIVMASHGRKGIKRVLLGSETQYVLTHSDVPVLVLR